MLDNLPTDIRVDILVRILSSLSVKEVIRCTLINKSSYELIHSKFFVDLYNNQHSQPNPTDPPLIFQKGKPYSDAEPENNQLYDCAPPPLPFRNPNRCKIVGSCNGLVFLYDPQGKRLILWNPYIHKSLTLPKPNSTLDGSVFGLGFVDHTCDYKVLIISHTNQAELYSLHCNSWKFIANSAPLSKSIIRLPDCDCVKGSLYWISSESGKSVLRLFDLKDEVFGVISLPDPWNALESSILDLMMPTESSIAVCRVRRDFEDGEDYDNVLVMDLINSDNKWRKCSVMDDDDISWTGIVCFMYLNKIGKVTVRRPYGRFIGVGNAFVKNLALLDKAGNSLTSYAKRRKSSRACKRTRKGEPSTSASNKLS